MLNIPGVLVWIQFWKIIQSNSHAKIQDLRYDSGDLIIAYLHCRIQQILVCLILEQTVYKQWVT